MPDPAPDETAGWTFDALARAGPATLEAVLRGGAAPDPAGLDGHVYRGWNHAWITTLSGRKFRKGFRRRAGQAFGYNELVRRDGRGPEGEWEPKLRRGRPRQLGYYRVSAVADEPPGRLADRYGRLALLDYGVGLNAGLTLPLRAIRDYVARANPGDDGLLVGKAYLRLGRRSPSVFATYFVLGHRRPIEHEPW